MSNGDKSVAELAAMRARGELTPEQFEEAKKLLNAEPSAKNAKAAPPTASEKKSGCLGAALVLIFIVFALGYCGSKADKSKSPAEQAAAQAEKTEKERKGFHCLSSWDGSHRDLVNKVTESLRDPSSFDHDETRITPRNEKGQHSIVMKFRAKNGFGGTNIGTAVATIRSSDCGLIDFDVLN